MEKLKAQHLIDTEERVTKNILRYHIEKAKNEQLQENIKNYAMLFIASFVLVYLVYLFYKGDLSIRENGNFNMEFTLVYFVKNVFLLWIIIRVIKSLLSIKERGFTAEVLININSELPTTENGIDKPRSECLEISYRKSSKGIEIVGFIIFYLFLFFALIVFLDYLGFFLYNSSKARAFLILSLPIVNSITGIMLIYFYISFSTYFKIRPFLNYFEIFTLLFLAIGIFSFLFRI